MKKNYALIILLVLTISIVFSQPSITYSGNAPQIGDIYYHSNTNDLLNPGPAGANQSWDFSEINVSSTSQSSIMNPNNTPFANDFPECNQVYHFNETSTYLYYDLSQDEMNHYGEGFDDNPPMIIYFTDPIKEIEYPFAYNNSFDDEYASSKIYEGLTWHTHGSVTTTADAWGSVTTPEDTYNNVLRVLSVRNQVDSVFIEDIFMYATTCTIWNYSWHTGSSHTPVMAISIFDSDILSDTTSNYTTSTQHVVNPVTEIRSLQVYPNPASDKILVSFTTNRINKITISIVDLTGKEIMQYQKDVISNGLQTFDLSLNMLKKGLYFVKIDDGNSTSSKKIIVR